MSDGGEGLRSFTPPRLIPVDSPDTGNERGTKRRSTDRRFARGITSSVVTGPDAAATFARNLFSALAHLGVRHAVLSPGSRNAPLALAADAEPGLHVTVVLDERAAGFTALGIAKSTRDPVVAISTSGTAAAHYHPAIAEARQARVPLLVITADRPPELQETGAPQTIDQSGLFGRSAKLSHDSGVPDADVAGAAHLLALRLYAAAVDAPAGPVHLDVALREPLVGVPVGEPAVPPRHVPGVPQLQPEGVDELARRLSGRRALVVAGGRQRSGFAAAAAVFGLQTGVPVIADIQCRQPGATVIACGDLLAAAGFMDRQTPEVVVRLGGIPTSKPVWRWLEDGGAEQVWIDDGPWRDPLSSGADAYRADPTATLSALADRMTAAPGTWTEQWMEANLTADDAAAAAIAEERFPNEPAIARAVAQAAPERATIYAGSSMPVRDLDGFSGPPRAIQVLANRGANGIDGLLSASAGAALEAAAVVCLAGDVAAIHDLNGMVTIAVSRLPVTTVVVNNDGGGIFHFLPQADPEVVDPAVFERLFGTPHGVSLSAIAEAVGISAAEPGDETELRALVAGAAGPPRLVELRTDRAENVAVHTRVRGAVAAALG